MTAESCPSTAAPPIRVVARHSADFLLARAVRGTAALGLDWLDGLALEILRSAGLMHRPYRDENGRWYGIDVVPDERRTAAITTIAASMGLPYETVRRRFARLAAEGHVAVSREGVRLVRPFARSAAQRRLIADDVAAFADMLDRLEAEGFAAAREGLDAIPAIPAAVVARVVSDMALRRIEHFIGLYGDLIKGSVASAIIAANVRHLLDDPALSARYADHDTPPPDALRRPVAIRELARQMNQPFETVRRRAAQLVDEGFVERRDDGLLVGAAILLRPEFRDVNEQAAQHLQQTLARLVALARTGTAVFP